MFQVRFFGTRNKILHGSTGTGVLQVPSLMVNGDQRAKRSAAVGTLHRRPMAETARSAANPSWRRA